MFITGPDVVKTVTGEEVTFEELGGAATHAAKSGVAHFISPRRGGVPRRRALPALLPAAEQPRARRARCSEPTDTARGRRRSSTRSSRTTRRKPYDIKRVIELVVDDGDFLEVHERYAENIVCGFARLGGHRVGVVGNQPRALAGVLDIDSSVKAARFVRTCDAFNIPLVTFVDVPGFLPGTAQEWGGIIRHGAKLLVRVREATVPKLAVITRKAYGGAYDVMSSKHIRRRLQLRLADGRGGGDGAGGRGQHRLPPRARGGDRPGGAAGGADRRLPRAVREPATSPPSVATSTT